MKTNKAPMIRRQSFLIILLQFYLLSVAIAIPVMNWQYARENGFIKWVMLGEIVATLKSTVWPYYLQSSYKEWRQDRLRYNSWSENEKKEALHMLTAIELDDNASSILKAATDAELVDQYAKALTLEKMALAESRLVSHKILAKIYIELPQHYETEFQVHLEKSVQAQEKLAVFMKARNHDPIAAQDIKQLSNEADQADIKWETWLRRHRDEIKLPKPKG